MNQPTQVSLIDQTRIPLDVDIYVGAMRARQRVMAAWRRLSAQLKAEWSLGRAMVMWWRRKIADFEIEPQCHSYWCWAAVAASVSAFYDETSTFSQCRIANLELHRQDCCTFDCGANGVEFNIMHTLGSALNRAGRLKRLVRFQRATRAEVQQEIRARRPLCVRTIWSGGGAHFVVIVGYSPDDDSLVIADPWRGKIFEVPFDRFCSQFSPEEGLNGMWNDTYYTR
jgi:Papain-like cysteine protease AvrRpt2